MRAVPHWLDALVALGFLDRDGSGERAIYLNTRETSHFLDRSSDAYIGPPMERSAETSTSDGKSSSNSLRTGENLSVGTWSPRAL